MLSQNNGASHPNALNAATIWWQNNWVPGLSRNSAIEIVPAVRVVEVNADGR